MGPGGAEWAELEMSRALVMRGTNPSPDRAPVPAFCPQISFSHLFPCCCPKSSPSRAAEPHAGVPGCRMCGFATPTPLALPQKASASGRGDARGV